MTSKKAILYYSFSGNTKYMVEQIDTEGFDLIPINHKTISRIDITNYETLVIATSTLGNGEIPPIFKRLIPQFVSLENKNIALFGSGNSIYPYYCGALDVFEDFLKRKNKILFKFKFEEFPLNKDIEVLENLFKNSIDN